MELLWLIPAMPLLGFLVLALAGRRIGTKAIAAVGVGTVAVSAAVAAIASWRLFCGGDAIVQPLWDWMGVAQVSLRLDSLSALMALVITFVGSLIMLYSTEFMAGDAGYSRYFAYMNLFVAAMLTLVLADNLLLLYVGWEGVGLCSFLLIGFWYSEEANARAARKAFIVTRIGDTAMMIGLLYLFTQTGSLDIQHILGIAAADWHGSTIPVIASALLLGGALGKSAQLPLQTWLPDAMAGPTPVSALIHAATMVTAGVYLIARMHTLFVLSPMVQLAVAIIGAATLVYAGMSALAQRDIKRVLAYSTISQIGYMFLALGVGAFSAAMFHFMTHAFFKSLLFLGAGVVILAMHHEHDMFKMGGLRKQMPLVFWTFLIGSASLASLPLVTAGFYSKDLILVETYTSPQGGLWLYAAGIFGALITAVYTFRMVFVTFFGRLKHKPVRLPGWKMSLPLVVLAGLSLVAGFVQTPVTLGGVHAFGSFVAGAFDIPGRAVQAVHHPLRMELALQGIAAVVAIGGVAVAYMMYGRREPLELDSPARRFFLAGWGFDWLYDRLLVWPYVFIAAVSRRDIIDEFFEAIAWMHMVMHEGLRRTQSGSLRWYAAGIAGGAIVTVAILVLA